MPRKDEPPPAPRDVVVIGASAGGVQALRTLASRLPANFPASLLVVLHTGAFPSRLPDILRSAGPNGAMFAVDAGMLRPGTFHVAPPDQHLLVRDGMTRLVRGPKEHHTRPAIDPLFRSAALWGGPRVIGVVLSGRNDDGTAGLQAIKSCGGIAVVQDPEDAEEPLMPRSALLHVRIDRSVPIERLADVLAELVRDQAPARPAAAPAPAPVPVLDALAREQSVSLGEGDVMKQLGEIGRPSNLVCPDCNGTLFELADDRPVRYRCHTGHAFTLTTLQQAQNEATEAALWSAIRALQEKESLMRKMAELDRLAGDDVRATQADADAVRLAEQVGMLRKLVEEG